MKRKWEVRNDCGDILSRHRSLRSAYMDVIKQKDSVYNKIYCYYDGKLVVNFDVLFSSSLSQGTDSAISFYEKKAVKKQGKIKKKYKKPHIFNGEELLNFIHILSKYEGINWCRNCSNPYFIKDSDAEEYPLHFCSEKCRVGYLK